MARESARIEGRNSSNAYADGGSEEMLASRLNTMHNLSYFADFMRRMRLAIGEGTFAAFRESFYRQQLEEQDRIACAEADGGAHDR